jgi:hypothetical protein
VERGLTAREELAALAVLVGAVGALACSLLTWIVGSDLAAAAFGSGGGYLLLWAAGRLSGVLR